MDGIDWQPLEPGQLKAMRISAAITALLLLVVVVAADFALHEFYNTIPGILTAPAVIILGYQTLVMTGRRFRRWGYAVEDRELHIAHGVLTHSQTSVAFHRVQHIDVSQGPVERMCGVCELVLNTAGTFNSRIRLPGLTRERAEGLRDEIRAHIRAEIA
jgi:uncharacterized protein